MSLKSDFSCSPLVQMFHCRAPSYNKNSLWVTYNDKHSTFAEQLKQGRSFLYAVEDLQVLAKETFLVSNDTSLTFSKLFHPKAIPILILICSSALNLLFL